MTRHCGSCTKCCELVPVKSLNKPGWHACPHMRTVIHAAGPGCDIYATRPFACANWSCLWIRSPEMTDAMRPDRIGVVVDEDIDLIRINGADTACAQIWVEAGHEEAFLDDPVRQIIAGLFEQGLVVLWRLPGGKEARVILVHKGQLAITPIAPADKEQLGPPTERMRRAAQLLMGGRK